MDSSPLRQALVLALGLVTGIGLVSLVTGDRPGVGAAIGAVLVSALLARDGPIAERTARIGAVLTAGGLLGAALLLY